MKVILSIHLNLSINGTILSTYYHILGEKYKQRRRMKVLILLALTIFTCIFFNKAYLRVKRKIRSITSEGKLELSNSNFFGEYINTISTLE